MKPPRISIKRLMATVAMIAVVFAALVRPNCGWANLLSGSYVLFLLIAPLGMILRRGRRQAGWIGFGLFGWSFLLAVPFLGESLPRLGQVEFYEGSRTNSISYGLDAISLNVSFLLRYLLNFLQCISDGTYFDQIREAISESGKIENFSTTVVTLSVIGFAFALLGQRIARSLARGGPFDPPAPSPT